MRTLLFVNCQCLLSTQALFSSGFTFSVYFLFLTYISLTILISLVSGFPTGPFFCSKQRQINLVSFVFDSTTFFFSLSNIRPFAPNALVPKSVFAPRTGTAQRDADKRISWRNHNRLRWTYTDRSVKVYYRYKYSDLLPPSQPKSRKCNVRFDPQFFQDLGSLLLDHTVQKVLFATWHLKFLV